jgi:hypothetical protein
MRIGGSGGLARSPVALWAAFALVHVEIVIAAFLGPSLPLGDVVLAYHTWMGQAMGGGAVVGIDGPWVYPILALLPLGLAAAFGLEVYAQVWVVMVIALNAVAFAFLIGIGRTARRHRAAWWWLAFLVLLGPIAIGRIDAVTVPIVIVALLFTVGRPRLAAALLAIAMWMNVWPAALIAALVIAGRARAAVIVSIAVTSVVVIGIALVLGAGWNVFSFITEQTGRGMQIEAPASTVWLWQAASGAPDAWVYYDRDLLTFQAVGPGSEFVSAIITPLLVLAVGALAAIGIRSAMRGARFASLFPPLALAFVLVLIVVNKVGSPQYICWLAAPTIIGIVYGRRRWLFPTVSVLAAAALTQLIYPYLYDALLLGNGLAIAVLTLRNLLEIVILVWAVVEVWRTAPRKVPLWKSDDAQSGAARA